MRKASVLLAVAATLLLLASFLPLSLTGTQAAAGPTAAPPPDLVQTGHDLFLAKGCITCHRHNDVDGGSSFIVVGPNLTNYQPDPDFVRAWLRDPAALRPETEMPNLNLSEDEIEALLAFLMVE